MSDICFVSSSPFTSSERRIIDCAVRTLEKYLRKTGEAFTTSEYAKEWVRLQFANLDREVFTVLYLDNQNRFLDKEILFLGTVNHTEIHPREIVKGALRHNAAAVILAHNHPSGYTAPSESDKAITRKIIQALALLEIRVLDHFIIGTHDVLSFAEHGLM